MRDDSVKPEFPDKVPGDLHLSWGRDSRRDLLERWPTTPEGEPVTPVFLTKCGQVDLEDRLLVNMLEAYGIPCLTRYPHSGSSARLCSVCPASARKYMSPKPCCKTPLLCWRAKMIWKERKSNELSGRVSALA